jgi:hypothetical protein
MDNFNRFHVTHQTDCSKSLPELMYFYSVGETNEINLTSIQVQVNVCGVFKKLQIQAHVLVNVESQKISLKYELIFQINKKIIKIKSEI